MLDGAKEDAMFFSCNELALTTRVIWHLREGQTCNGSVVLVFLRTCLKSGQSYALVMRCDRFDSLFMKVRYRLQTG